MRYGKCDLCGAEEMINEATGIGELCAACFDRIGIDNRRPPAGRGRADDDGGPGFHNVVRAMEEDR